MEPGAPTGTSETMDERWKLTRYESLGGDAGTRLYTKEGAAFFGRSDAQSESVRPAWRETLFLAET